MNEEATYRCLKNGYQENFIVSQKKWGKTSCNVVRLFRPTFPSNMFVVELVFDGRSASLNNNRNLGY